MLRLASAHLSRMCTQMIMKHCKTIATMKNLFKSLMLVAVAAMAFTACTETNEEVNAVSKGTTINFNVSFADETRVSLTDDNEDGVYQAAFEAGDVIVFAAYDLNGNMLTYTEEITLTEEQAADENLTLTANFKSEVGVGSEIKAYVNYYYDKYWGYWGTYVSCGYQVAMVDSVDNLNASAELVWNGEEYANIIFKHDNSFGKMTLKADGDVKFREVSINLCDGEGNYKSTTVVDYEQKVNNVFFFALSGEALNVSTLNVEAYDVNDNLYQFAKEFEPGQFHFKKGRVSKFTIDKWYVSLDMPEVKATPSVDGKEVVFSWEPDANAAGYEVRVGYNEPTFTQETSYKVSLAGYNPFETVYISVKAKAGKDTMFMDSQMANASYTVPINKNADGENGYTFVYTQVEERGTNKYKFYNDNEKEYMYVYFEDDITALEPGSYVYSLNDGVIGGTGDSAYRHPLYDNGGYLEFWFQGEFMMFVDVADDKTYTITTFCKRGINDGDHLYKSTWTGKFGGSVEPEPEPEPEDPETVELLYASAAPAPSDKIGGTGYDVTFVDANGNNYIFQVQTLGNAYLEEMEYSTSYNWDQVGYINNVTWPGVSAWPASMDVKIVNGQYDINLSATDSTYYGGTGLTHTAHFKGNISGMTLPGEEPTISTYEFVNAIVSRVGDYGYTDFDVQFYTAAGDTLQFNFYNCQVDANANYIPVGTYAVGYIQGACIFTEGYSYFTLNGTHYDLQGGSVSVAEVDGQYSIVMDGIYYGDNLLQFNGSYTGAISKLVVPSAYVPVEPEPEPEPEDPEVPEDVTPFNRFQVTGYGTDVEVRFYFDEGTNNFVYVDFPGGSLESKTYTSFNAGYSGIFIYTPGSGTQSGSVTGVNMNVEVLGNNMYTFVGTIETTLGTYNVNISGTSAFE